MDTAKVTLYYFEDYDLLEDKIVRSKRPATLEFIKKFHLHPVLDNQVEVDTSQLDAEGLLAGDS
ncbi:MAG: hypothetical protein WC213_05710 [Arenimonas sp.]|jgi:hypothetical protein